MFNFKKRKLKKNVKKFVAQVNYVLHADDDILTQKQQDDLRAIRDDVKAVDCEKPDEVKKLLASGNQRFRRAYPPKGFALIREYADIIAVAVAVAFGIRGLFLQPFKIPTGSMQPTLFGIHYMQKKDCSNKMLTYLPPALNELIFGSSRAELSVKQDGFLNANSVRQYTSGLFFTKTSFNIGDVNYTLPGEVSKVISYTGLNPSEEYKSGQELCDGWLSTGDHLFVDRFSIQITGLKRGDIVVFNTGGIMHDGEPLTKSGYYYIKRLVGMPGDTLRIINNMLFVKPEGADEYKPIVAFSDKFKKLYSGKGGYAGHLSVVDGSPGEYLGAPEDEVKVPKDCYFMMGDNSYFSSDSRIWGFVPRSNIVGRALFVFWPFSRRWGIPDNKAPLDVETGLPGRFTYPAMRMQ
ncbi:signal peptidase I [Lentisphaerota bacterium ZTH]|nr:signal peptidase I [Lentisphaerota bacterium]WET07357.1 signal peptidase I [Lentisphaerota bacterium ZTH]